MNKQLEEIEGTGAYYNNKHEIIVSTFNKQSQPTGYTVTYMPQDQFKITNCKDGQEPRTIFQGKGLPKQI